MAIVAKPDKKSWFRAQLTPRKLTFYTLFHGFHVLLFVVGWYVQETDQRLAALNALNMTS